LGVDLEYLEVDLGYWDLGVRWSLGFGAWDLTTDSNYVH
jgi:hypothetical protein